MGKGLEAGLGAGALVSADLPREEAADMPSAPPPPAGPELDQKAVPGLEQRRTPDGQSCPTVDEMPSK